MNEELYSLISGNRVKAIANNIRIAAGAVESLPIFSKDEMAIIWDANQTIADYSRAAVAATYVLHAMERPRSQYNEEFLSSIMLASLYLKALEETDKECPKIMDDCVPAVLKEKCVAWMQGVASIAVNADTSGKLVSAHIAYLEQIGDRALLSKTLGIKLI